jgi:transcriptional regulator with XRE-family HTH domain
MKAGSNVPTGNIKMRRQILGVSQEFLARQIGVDPVTLARWEAGTRMPATRFKDKLNCFLILFRLL